MVRVAFPSGLHAAAADWHRALLGGLALIAACLLLPGHNRLGPLPTTTPRADRVVFVIVDGLRVDEAADPDLMPFVAALSERAVARVECELPSSIAAIETWTTGRIPTLRSFLGDFSTAPQARGGLLERLHADGRPAFISGPTLWTGRFGPWIEGVGDDSWGVADPTRADQLQRALAQDRRGLLIVHFDQLDRAGHRGEDTATACRTTDAYLRGIAGSLRGGDVLLVTSDHGRTAAGGHAGPELEVVQTPLLAIGCELPPTLSQAQTGDLLADLSGVSRSRPGPGGSQLAQLVWIVAAATAFVLCTNRDAQPTPRQAAVLGIGSLVAFVSLLGGWFVAVIATAAVVAGLRRSRVSISRWLAAGVGLAVVRWAMPGLLLPSTAWFAAGTGLAAVTAATLPNRWAAAGLVLLPMLQGQTASLSSIQTGPGFVLMERSGPAAGVALTVLLHAVPWLVLGASSFRHWSRWRPVLGATLLTTAVVRLVDPAATQLLVRLVCEVAMLGVGAGAAWLSQATLWVPSPSRQPRPAESTVPVP